LACKANKVNPATIGKKFADATGLSIYEADAATIEAFTETITNQKLRVVKPDA
jgi:hypothetical protein